MHETGPRGRPQGSGTGKPQPHGGSGDRQERANHRRGISPRLRRQARRDQRHRERCRGSPRGGILRDTRTVQSLRQDASLCGPAYRDCPLPGNHRDGRPNPLVAGRGIKALKRHGIATKVGVLEEDCRRLNETFFTYMERGTPFITVKYAQTLDGRIAASTGDSRWISSLKSRRFAHRLRSLHDAVLVGSGTALADDPELTVRLVRGRNPVRVVIDSRLRVPLDAHLFNNIRQARTVAVTSTRSDPSKRERLQERDVDILTVPEVTPGLLDLREIFAELGRLGLSSVLVEGGAGIITSCLLAGCVDRLVVITAPRILGSGIDAVGDLRLTAVEQSLNLRFEKVSRSDGDLIIDARVKS
ncbi:MAG TPA: bifunctional diaminohydroxyphosphoribosylaminopyrimidine deaminase/5-amino-6-(5-phosphoribosylamino)uracil reductase RibD [Deltaproteobacteria bacterium]|nr:bifunctional diaminohydroxyphosphoribosylaminopyrimidine deaminase/5-amino-6-(5-phosphoribosylamino)uracil reductase RibD [Deltaproteobacteria bacterium]